MKPRLTIRYSYDRNPEEMIDGFRRCSLEAAVAIAEELIEGKHIARVEVVNEISRTVVFQTCK